MLTDSPTPTPGATLTPTPTPTATSTAQPTVDPTTASVDQLNGTVTLLGVLILFVLGVVVVRNLW